MFSLLTFAATRCGSLPLLSQSTGFSMILLFTHSIITIFGYCFVRMRYATLVCWTLKLVAATKMNKFKVEEMVRGKPISRKPFSMGRGLFLFLYHCVIKCVCCCSLCARFYG